MSTVQLNDRPAVTESSAAAAAARTHAEWLAFIDEHAASFAERDAAHDRDDSFVADTYAELRAAGLLSAAIPSELGGGGLSHAEMADVLRALAQVSPSAALANSMHQHLVAANVWKYVHGKGGEELLRKVAASEPILISTGAKDWIASNGRVEKVDGGYRVSGRKYFASQSAIGDIAVTSAPYEDPEQGWQVLHFSVPMKAPGVGLIENWQALGMRGTGSHTIVFDRVFVPESAVVLRRTRGEYHPVFYVILTVAMPLIMSVYIGIAQKAARIAIERVQGNPNPQPYLTTAVGELNNTLQTAEIAWSDMLRLAGNYQFQPSAGLAHDIVTRKTIVANAVVAAVAKALDIVGGQGYYRSFGLEKLFRDAQAAKYHPLPEQEQLVFSGKHLLEQ